MKRIIQIMLFLLLISGTVYGQEKDTPKRPKLYLNVDKLPTFDYKGGIINYVFDSLKYLYQLDAWGVVLVSFVVQKDGSVTNVKKENGLGAPFDLEVIRVIENMPKWTPGEKNSEKVDVLLYVPIRFGIDGKYEEKK